MARYFVYFTDGGTPKTGLTPAWYQTDGWTLGASPNPPAAVADLSLPAIGEIGAGLYYFDWDPDTDGELIGVIDGGTALADARDRYMPAVASVGIPTLNRMDQVWDAMFNTFTEPSTGSGPATLNLSDGTTKNWNITDNRVTRTRTPA